MGLTQVKTTGIADDAITSAKIADDAVVAAAIADDVVAEAHIANDAISLTELKAGTDGQIITWDASGNPTAVGPGTDGQVLTSTGAGSPPAFEALPASGVTVSNNVNNRVVTGDGTNLNAEAGVTCDGTHLSITDGDLVIGTSGHGIDFSAHGQAGGMTQELLDDYEEGTFTADVIHQGSTSNTGHYVKIGRLVIANFRLTTLTATGNNNHQAVGGLPFTIKNVTSAGAGARGYQTYNVGVYDASPNSTAAYMYTNTGGNITAVNVGNKVLTGSIIYITDS